MSKWHYLYNTAVWKRRRQHQLTIEPLCRMCKQVGRTIKATVADHIEPHNGDEAKFHGGELASLCKACHDRHKQSQERTGHLRGCDASGQPLDPLHPWNRKTA